MKILFMNNSGFSEITAELNYVSYISNYYPYEIWDLSETDNRKGTFVNIEEAITIRDMAEFEERLAYETHNNHIVIVSNMVLSAYSKYYGIIKKYGIPVINTQKNNFMKFLEQRAGLDFSIDMPFQMRLKRVLNNFQFVRAINKRFRYGSVKFDYLFSAYNFAPEEVHKFKKSHNGKYDEFLKYKNSSSPLDYDYILFIDSATCYHPADYKDDKNFDEQHHLKQLNNYFDIIEQETGLPIVISLHPCSVGHLNDECFGGRKTVYSQTALYIQHSQFVISFFSTSLINVILANKPSLIIYSEEILSSKRRTQQECAFVLSRMCDLAIDSLDCPNFKYPIVNIDKYNKFAETYLINVNERAKSNGEMIVDLIKTLDISPYGKD